MTQFRKLLSVLALITPTIAFTSSSSGALTQSSASFSRSLTKNSNTERNLSVNSRSSGNRFTPQMAASIFDFDVADSQGKSISLKGFQNKPVTLIVNVASAWGLTAQNYAELQTLYEKYGSQGLEIIGFPCNQFGGQEPGSNAEIQAFAKGKGATFPILGKLEVNGPGEDPLFTFLKSKQGGFLGSALKWNFSKFLCTNGVPVKRYAPTDSPLSFEQDIVKELEKGLAK